MMRTNKEAVGKGMTAGALLTMAVLGLFCLLTGPATLFNYELVPDQTLNELCADTLGANYQYDRLTPEFDAEKNYRWQSIKCKEREQPIPYVAHNGIVYKEGITEVE